MRFWKESTNQTFTSSDVDVTQMLMCQMQPSKNSSSLMTHIVLTQTCKVRSYHTALSMTWISHNGALLCVQKLCIRQQRGRGLIGLNS